MCTNNTYSLHLAGIRSARFYNRDDAQCELRAFIKNALQSLGESASRIRRIEVPNSYMNRESPTFYAFVDVDSFSIANRLVSLLDNTDFFDSRITCSFAHTPLRATQSMCQETSRLEVEKQRLKADQVKVAEDLAKLDRARQCMRDEQNALIRQAQATLDAAEEQKSRAKELHISTTRRLRAAERIEQINSAREAELDEREAFLALREMAATAMVEDN
jgi:hypothetical protein